MRKTIIYVLCLMLAFTAAACSGTSSVTTDGGEGSGYSRVTDVTGSGYEYTASVDQDSLSCSVEYESTGVDINEGEFVTDDDEEYFVLHMTFYNNFDLITYDSSVEDTRNQDALDRSYVIQAVQGDEVIYPRDEVEAETIEEDNAYEMIDAGSMINCDYWFPVDASQPVTIQILNIDGEDTVMAELTFPANQDDEAFF